MEHITNGAHKNGFVEEEKPVCLWEGQVMQKC
jgi:hypothetical protein